MEFLYDSGGIFALNKPGGLHSVGLPDDSKDSLASRLLKAFPELKNASEKSEDGGLIHRLDFETSGVIVGARTREIWLQLRELLMSGKINKFYTILAEGKFPEHQELNNFIGNPNRRGKKMRIYQKEPAKSARALSASSVLNTLKYNEKFNVSVVEVTAHTARRHQVRAHSAHLGNPLVGDNLYGSERSIADLAEELEIANAAAAALPKFILHATRVEFPNPATGKTVQISAPIPTIIQAFMN